MKRGAIIFGIVLFLVGSISAADYYVNANIGNDSNNGLTPATAWKTINKINGESFNPGDNLYFARGEIWREQLIVSSSGNPTDYITFGTYGNGEEPIISAFDNAAVWIGPDGNGEYTHDEATEVYVFLEDGNKLLKSTPGSLNNGMWGYSGGKIYYKPTDGMLDIEFLEKGIRQMAISVEEKSYLKLENISAIGGNSALLEYHGSIDIVNSSNIQLLNMKAGYGSGSGIRLTYSSNLIVLNSEVISAGRSGIIAYQSTGSNLISKCNVSYSGFNHPYPTDDAEGIAFNQCSGFTVSDCIIHNIYKKNSSTGKKGGIGVVNYFSNNMVYKYNYIYENGMIGMIITGGENIDVFYNLIFNNGIKIEETPSQHRKGLYIDSWNLDSSSNIFNNIIYNNKGGSSDFPTTRNANFGVLIGHGVTVDLNLKNNIISEFDKSSYSGWEVSYEYYNDSIFNLNSDNNLIYCLNTADTCFFNYGIGYDRDHIVGNSAGYYSFDWGHDYNSIISDPLFINSAILDFHLYNNSPAINKGIDVGLTADFDGNPIIGLLDIGAFEYQGVLTACSSGTDVNYDSVVSISELLGFISSWKSGEVSIGELLNGISEWKGGCS